MGMDVYGKNPTSEVGEYFRNNMWWWRPLASFVTERYPALTEACTYWQSNDGDGLDAAGAIALADAIDLDLSTGAVDQYAAEYAAALAALPTTPCDLCDGTGLRTDGIGVANGFDVPRDEATGKGGCNGCNGTGQREPFERSYPFEVANVREFSAFLRASGGFEIW